MAATEFIPPEPGTWTVLAREEANHEAAHALAAVLLDVGVNEVRIDRPDIGTLGQAVTEKQPPESRWKHLAVSLAPLIVSKRCPDFPPSLNSDDGDEFKAAVVAHDLHLDESEYDGIVGVISELLNLPSSRRAFTALAGALLEKGALPGDEVRQVIQEAQRGSKV